MAAAPPVNRPAPSAGPAADVVLRTTITGNSIQRMFGAPGAIDYRSHPGQRDADAPAAVFAGMKSKEVMPLQDIKFLKGTIYSYKNRKVITRWLRDVCAAFQLKGTTLALAVQLTDAYIIRSLDTLAVQKCQLAAITALWISAKFEELDESLPKLRQIVDVCDGAYSGEDVINMEEDILDSFKWRIPHTTVMNHIYLLLHIHSLIPPYYPPNRADESLNANVHGGGDLIPVELMVVDPDSKQRQVVRLSIPLHTTFLQILPQLCTAIRIPFSSTVEVFELLGTDFFVAKRIPLQQTPGERRIAGLQQKRPVSAGAGGAGAGPLRLFLANSRQCSPIFAERDELIVLKSVNGLLIHCALDLLGPEVVTHVEFLRLPSHVVALGVLALARCLIGHYAEETRVAIAFILKQLDIPGAQALAAADLLCDKYQEALAQPQGLPAPLIPIPADVRDRLKYVFSRGAA
jgi:hypothetical protein